MWNDYIYRMENRKYLVTSALPYANGYIHLGHIAGAYLPADMYVRYRRLLRDDILFICGSDEHGTAIEISAMKENVTPQKIIDRYHYANKDAFEKLGISFDIYSRTSNPIHHKTSQEFFLNLYNKGLLYRKSEKQLYSEKDKKYLADRFLEGTCPICGYEEARGDQCENCGNNLSPLELINPKSKISGDTPIVKESTHYYFPLEKFQTELENWVSQKTNWKPNVKNYCEGWFKTGLKDRAITRDLDWGVKVPLENSEGKVIYVWFEAVLGYISATKELFISRNESEDKWKEYWNNKDSKLIHFIGKDNIIFHSILFPAMIMAHGDINLPYNVPANEFLNIAGGKFSKSKGVGNLVKDIVNEFNPDLVRYVIASNLPENKDSEFSYDDFQVKNNNELAAILGNFINRTVVFIKTKFDNTIPVYSPIENDNIFNEIKSQAKVISEYYEDFRFRDAVNETMNLIRMANKYFNDSEPWKAIKENKDLCASIINNCLQICLHIAIAINPILPFTTKEILKILNANEDTIKWNNIGERILKVGTVLGENKILFPQIEIKEDAQIISKPADSEIDIDYFKKINLRVAKVMECEKIEKSKKLLKLKVKIDNVEKQIVAGVAEYYSPADLIGKSIVIVNNLKKSKLMGIESQGMLLAAKKDGKLKVLFVDPEIQDGGEIS